MDAELNKLQAARLKEANAKADIAELRYRIEIGEIVGMDDAMRELSDAIATVRARVSVMPARLAAELSAERDPAEIQRILDAVVQEATA